METMKEFLTVFVGGGLGSVLRYGVQSLLHERIVAYNFPWATFAVNIVGCFLIGMFYGLSASSGMSVQTRVFLTAGLCGGFTTFSTFSNDSIEMMRQGQLGLCLMYILLSVVLGICACWLGGGIFSAKNA